jgi:Fungal Zn(2)-Cys(6) binuclear cluster domain
MPTPEQSSLASSSRAAAKQKVLACVLCQRRKVKCERKFPCANCVRAGAQCVPATAPTERRRRFPSGNYWTASAATRAFSARKTSNASLYMHQPTGMHPLTMAEARGHLMMRIPKSWLSATVDQQRRGWPSNRRRHTIPSNKKKYTKLSKVFPQNLHISL